MTVSVKRSEHKPALSPALNIGGAAAPAVGTASPLAALLAGHMLQDGEIILLILKPSIWFVVLSMLRSAAVVLMLMIASVLFDSHLPGNSRTYVEIGALLLGVRFMWAVMQWMSRVYILTDMRILSLSGVSGPVIFDCPLRKVARTRVLRTTRERIFRLGSIEIIPSEESFPITQWQTIARPFMVHDQIVAAINRAKQGRCDLPGA